jgi:hypothetical protein
MVKRVRMTRKGSGGGDEVGYGKPPKHTRFRPGRSGNPNGRPTGSRNFKTELLEKLKSTVKVNQNGRVSRISTQRAGIEVLVAKALSGDQRAIDQFVRLAEKYDEPSVEASGPLSSDDQAILDAYAGRLKQE